MKKLAKWSTQWHRKLKWFAGATLFIWAISGVMHPIISWTGPKSVNFYPPKLKITSQSISNIKSALATSSATLNTTTAASVKVLPSKIGPVLQFTHDQISPRQYIEPTTNQALIGYDLEQARWLATYYTGFASNEIGRVDFITEYTQEYPSVNRLLPVYRISFPEKDNLVAFVHTETGALAQLTNARKTFLQSIFQVLHTWNWLDFTGFGRVLIVGLLILSLFMMSVVGIGLIASIPSRKIKDPKRRWHRMTAYFLWLPLLGWSTSGFYHLLKAEYVAGISGIKLDKHLSLSEFEGLDTTPWLTENIDQPLNAISIVRASGEKLLLRMGIAQERNNGQHITRAKKYEGRPTEKNALYIDAQTGKKVELNDRERAIWLATQFSGYAENTISNVSIVTRFGGGYDFRNKRLPVWNISFNDSQGTSMYIDPVTGVLVDQARNIDKTESLSFSLLHKWNHLNIIMSRQMRDTLIVITLLLCCGMGIVGLLFSRKKRV